MADLHVCPECGLSAEAAGSCPADGAALVPPEDDQLLGQTIGSYRVARLLGAGGMGRVYRAVQPAIGGRVAVKVLASEHTRDRALVERFFAEARAVNLIRHEHIVNVLDLAQLPDGRPYIIMEYLDGAPLSAIIDERGPLPLGGLARLVGEVLDALDAAHGKGIVHRDLKPDNVFVTPAGHAKVLDFGIAKLAPGLEAGRGRTKTGALLGTPAYMSPEQCMSGAVDARTDLYATGILLYEGATGSPPFTGSLFELLNDHVGTPPTPPRARRAEVPPALERVILRALEKRPEDRFPSAAEMAVALAEAAQALPPESFGSLGTAGDRKGLAIGPRAVSTAASASRVDAAAPTVAGASAGVAGAPATAAPAQNALEAAPPPPPGGAPSRVFMPVPPTAAGGTLPRRAVTTASGSAGQVEAPGARRADARRTATLLAAGLAVAVTAVAVVLLATGGRGGRPAAAPGSTVHPGDAAGAVAELAGPLDAAPLATGGPPDAAPLATGGPPDAAPLARGARADAARATGGATSRREAPDAAPAVAVTPPNPRALIDQARKALAAGQAARALELAEQALGLAPGDAGTRSIAATAACAAGRADRAREHVERLDGRRADLIRQACAAKGIVLAGGGATGGGATGGGSTGGGSTGGGSTGGGALARPLDAGVCPATLTAPEIKRTLRKASVRVQRCADALKHGVTADVALRVAGSGKVLSVEVTGEAAEVGASSCLEMELGSLSFPRFCGGDIVVRNRYTLVPSHELPEPPIVK